jgi:hypothetical protein
MAKNTDVEADQPHGLCEDCTIAARGRRRSGLEALAAPSQLAFDVAGRVSLRDGLTLVLMTAAFRKSEIDFGPTVLEVKRQRHERESLTVHSVAQPFDLVTMHEQLSPPVRIECADTLSKRPWGNVNALEPAFAVLEVRVGVGQLDLGVAERLHLGAREHETGLDRVQDRVLMPSAAVRGDEAGAGRTGHGGSPTYR